MRRHIEISHRNIDLGGTWRPMMFYFSITACVVVATFFFCRYLASKTRMVEKEIEKVVARKLATSERAIEVAKLREDNAVMRNLLLDLVENESVLPISQRTASTAADQVLLKRHKVQRYREILAESVHVLYQR